MALLIPHDTAGLDPKVRAVIDDIVARIQVWAGKVDEGINRATPGFLAYNSADVTGVVTLDTVRFDRVVYDETNNFAANTFTAPVAGRYLLSASVFFDDGSAINQVRGASLLINSLLRGFPLGRGVAPATTDEVVASGAVVVDLVAGDRAYVTAIVTAATSATVKGDTFTIFTFFSGRLLS